MIVRVTRRLRKKRIVILGGGFGGVYAAIHLEKLLKRESTIEIRLVSRDNFFLFTPMLHEIAASDLEITMSKGAFKAVPALPSTNLCVKILNIVLST